MELRALQRLPVGVGVGVGVGSSSSSAASGFAGLVGRGATACWAAGSSFTSTCRAPISTSAAWATRRGYSRGEPASLALSLPLPPRSAFPLSNSENLRRPARSRRPSGCVAQLSHSSDGDGGAAPQEPPQDAVLKAISEISKLKGRNARTTNVVIGGTESPASSDWMDLDKKVNTYPSFRGFTAIGTGGSDFAQSMIGAVESVLEEPIPQGQVSLRESARGKYISVKIGPMKVESSLQVRRVYQEMRKDVRMKYFL